MGISVERLRIWLIVGAALLAMVIAGFLGYARYRTHRFLAGLPGKLGIDIRRETNGYTYSQSVGGKTVMTLHAAKAVEHKDGKLTLHDVSMILYGRKQDRADRISGAEFEYEQASGVVRAVGEVHIDLQAPANTEAKGKTPAPPTQQAALRSIDDHSDENGRLIHVKTSGLVYLQKLGIAATDQQLEFRFGNMTGYARGAEYNADTGIVIFQSDVRTNGFEQGKPMVLTASHAELDRQNQKALLTEAKYVSPGETVKGDHALVHLRKDGSPERIEADGHVSLSSPAGGLVAAPRADVLLSATNQAQSVHLFGGVSYEAVESLREGKGQAQDARIAFDALGHPENVVLAGNVHVNERVRASADAGSLWSVRDAMGGRMTFVLVNGSEVASAKGRANGRKVLRDAEVRSDAHVVLVTDQGGPASTRSELSGNVLQMHFMGEGRTTQLATVRGTGQTSMRRVGIHGEEQTSAGETLMVEMRPRSAEARVQHAGGSKVGSDQIEKATQTGHVVLTTVPVTKLGAAASAGSKAMADLAVYEGDTDQLTLSGHSQVADGLSTIAAQTIVLLHGNGDATARGAVKASYLQAPGAEPVHILADHADLKHEEGRALFYGTAAKAARLWQGASQVEAPVIEMEQEKRKLTARNETEGAGPAAVHAVLTGDAQTGPATNPAGKQGTPSSVGRSAQTKVGATRPSVVRVTSRTMVYLDKARQVDFAGEVKVEDADAALRSEHATVYLRPAATPAPRDGSPASNRHTDKAPNSSQEESGVVLGGSVDRIVAKGSVEMEQTGRRASGNQLTYTASDRLFVLTGTPSTPPRLIDQVQGTVTGSALRFHTGDDSVTVIGGAAANPDQKVHTVTRVKQK